MDIFKKIITICLLSAVLPCVSLSQIAQDVNRDSYVNSGDVTALYSYLIAGDDTFLATSDVNGDDYVTSADVTAVYDYILYHDSTNDRRMSFLHISDTHSVDVTLQPALEILNSDPTYSFMILTGDFLPTEAMMQEVLASEKPVFIIPGNHDSWNEENVTYSYGQQGFREQVLNRLYPNGEVNFGDDIANFFYADVTQNGCTIRVIGLDLYDFDNMGRPVVMNSVVFSQKQIDWLIEVLEDSYDKDGVIIMTHNGFGNSRQNSRDPNYINEFVSINAYSFWDTYNYSGDGDAILIPSIIEAYMTGNNLTDAEFKSGHKVNKVSQMINVTTNFDGPHNNFIAYYGGHIHFDVVEYLSGFPNQLMCIVAYGGRGKGNNWNDLIKTNTGEDSYTINASNINFTTHEHQIVRLGSQKKDDGTLRQSILFTF
ncbi:MAG: metallophosphoesterase [Muribaculaceae bacterium]|nr:metallophosphoesterase [Muribaculaceae bacterium]